MTRDYLRHLIARNLRLETAFTVSRSPQSKWGEFSTNAPLVAAKIRGLSAEQIGQTLANDLSPHFPGRIEVSGGKLNFFMSDQFLHSSLQKAAHEGAHFGIGNSLAGQRILVEYVSSDPTGPLPFSAGRLGAIGESLCRLLENQGARLTREFYLNDATSSSKNQLLGESVSAWYLSAFGQKTTLDNIENGAFVRGIASDLARRDGAKWLHVPTSELSQVAAQAALEAAINSQKATLERFGIRFDEWVSESGLRADGKVASALEKIAQSGHSYEKDGALWLRTTTFGDDSDRVLRRSNNVPTYFAGDIAYHLWKFERGFDKIINIWSVEHKPYIQRTKAALRAAGIDESKFEFLVCENAVLKRDGVPLRLGIGGAALLLDEEMEELGVDALKFFFLRENAQKTAPVDLEIAGRDDESNPAYAVQLLPSRIGRLRREAEGKVGGDSTQEATGESVEFVGAEHELARLVALWPDTSQEAATTRAPEKVVAFLMEMSVATRNLLKETVPSEAPLSHRIELLRAAGNVASSALKILGIEARERF
jgi:arginyl-tRNA synthetase